VLLRGATLATLDPPAVEAADLRVEGDRIVERSPGLSTRPGEESVDLGGALVLPGLVNGHTHLYSALARGMPAPPSAPRGLVGILEQVWWRLDRALDEESIYLSGLVGAIEAALSGTTLVFDHHASPNAIRGSLTTLRRALEALGLRSVLSYEVTDRNGTEGRERGIAENEEFVRGAAGPLTRGMPGAHASFTLAEESLARLAALARETGAGLHVHVAEDPVDVEDCRRRFSCGLLERFARHGLPASRTLFAHGVHLTPDELAEAQLRGAWLIHNPRSNMNNAVGHAHTEAMKRAALGTDGLDQDMLAEARAAHLKMREAGRPDAAAAALELLAGGHRLAAAVFGLPFGRLGPGAPADLAVLDYRPPTPLHAGNLGGHLLFGLDRSHVSSVMVAGRWIVRDRRLTTMDAEAVLARARSAAQALWERMARL
jgi:putative selenium metabolism protein SsnA